MYAPTHFEETDLATLHALIGAQPLGAIVTHGEDGLSADHIPFEIGAPTPDAPFGVLRAHVARANRLWQRAGADSLVVFQGPQAYISPSFYEEKQATGKVVPTWDYAVVHAHGVLRAIEDPAWILTLLERLTAHHEAPRKAPWSVHDAPRDYIDKLLNAIVGLEIPLTRLEGKWKVSQNRPRQDQANIAAGLNDDMGTLIAARLARS
jgi:transcriptional regulator